VAGVTWLLARDVITAFTSEGEPIPSSSAIRTIAHRDGWRRIKVGHHAAYDLDDVTDTILRRRAARRLASNLTPV
jgi:hypothetical protein